MKLKNKTISFTISSIEIKKYCYISKNMYFCIKKEINAIC